MINEVDVAWNEEWTGTSQTGFLSLDGNRLTIRTLIASQLNPNSAEKTLRVPHSRPDGITWRRLFLAPADLDGFQLE